MAPARSGIFYGWIVVTGAFAVTFLSFGAAYSFGAAFDALEREFGASRAALSTVFSLAGVLYFMLGVVSGPLTDRIGPRPVIAFGILAAGLGMVYASRADGLSGIYLGYGLGIGIGVGFCYVPAMASVQRWFTRRRGLAAGLAVAGVGMGTMVVPWIMGTLVLAQGWRTGYLVIGLGVLGLGLFAAALMDGSPERRGLRPDGDAPPAAGTALGGGADPRIRDALRARPFWVLYAIYALASAGLYLPFVHLVPYALDRGIGVAEAAALLSFVGAGSAGGRFALGGIADRFGRRGTLGVMVLGQVALFLWWLGSESYWQLAVFGLVFGVFYGGLVALQPALAADYFAGRHLSGIMGAFYTSPAIGVVAGPVVAGLVYDLTQSYTIPIASSAAVSLFAAALTLALAEPRAWRHGVGAPA